MGKVLYGTPRAGVKYEISCPSKEKLKKQEENK
jgi:hypothetical protein